MSPLLPFATIHDTEVIIVIICTSYCFVLNKLFHRTYVLQSFLLGIGSVFIVLLFDSYSWVIDQSWYINHELSDER